MANVLLGLAFVSGFLGFNGLLLGMDLAGSRPSEVPMTLPAGAVLMLLSIAAMLRSPDTGVGRMMLSPGLDGMIVRRMLPVGVGIPLISGLVASLLIHFQILDQRQGLVGFAMFAALLTGFSVVLSASWIRLSERKRAQAETRLTESERAARQLVEQLPLLVWTCNSKGECDFLGTQWVEYTGIPEQPQLGYGWLEQIHPDDREPTGQRWNETVGQGRPFEAEFRIRRHDGIYRWFKTRANPLIRPDGTADKWFGTNTDIDDQKRAEEELRKINTRQGTALAEQNLQLIRSKSDLEEAQKIAHVGSWVLDVATGEVDWSDELFRIFGMELAATPPNYHTQQALFTEDSWSRLTAAISHSIATGEGYELELEFVRADGDVRWATARAAASKDASGNVVRLAGTFHDITESKRTSLELKAANDRVSLATESAGIGIWEWSVADGRLRWDDTMLALYGRSADAPAQAYADWSNALHPDDRAAAERSVAATLEKRARFEERFRIVLPNGQVRHLRAAARTMVDDAGTVIGMVGVNWDETAIHAATAALEASQSLLRQFVKHAPAAIAMLDRDLRYLQVSDRWIKDYHLTGQDVIGRGHYEVFPDVPERWKAIHQNVLRGAVERCDEDPFPRESGGMEWLQWEARPWFDAAGKVGGLIFFTQVITERKRMELLLVEQRDELKRSNQELEQFAYAASHDLQEPLRAVISCTEMLRNGYSQHFDADALELMGFVTDGANRMRALITDLLEYSRVGRGGGDLVEVDLAEVAAEAQDRLTTVIEETGARIEWETPSLPVWADRREMVQLFQNLLGNALKYRSERPPQIRLRCHRADGSTTVEVEDNGIGIDKQHYNRVFVLFQRLHTVREYSGTGIGLALCKKIVEGLKGTISVRSQVGAGSCFSFSIPDKTPSTP